MPEGVTLTPELAGILREMARLYRANGWPSMPTQQEPRYFPPDSILFVNRSGEEIPPYACMQIDGTIEEDGRTLLEVVKPNATTLVSENQLLFNESRSVATNQTGVAQHPSIVRARKQTSQTEDTVGGGWNYTDGQWYLSPNGPFAYYGTTAIDVDTIVVKCPSGGDAGKSGHAVLPNGAPSAVYASSANIGGGSTTTGVRPRPVVAFKLKWEITGTPSALDAFARRTQEAVTLYNPLPIAIPADAVVQWKENDDGFKMIDTWICGVGIAGPIVGPNPGDPIGGGSSKSISLAYVLGI